MEWREKMGLKRVVITGRGAVSPFGLGVATLFENLWRGNSAVGKVEEWQDIVGLNSLIAAPVPPFESKKLLPRSVRRTAGAMGIYAILAAKEALKEAGISEKELSSDRVGVIAGSTTGSAAAYENFYSKYMPDKKLDEIKSGEFFKIMGHSCAANICQALGITGEQWATVSACTSSSQSIGLGYILLQAGRQDMMLCGGADEVHASVTGVFDLLRAASCNNDNPKEACRPFDKDRDGVVCGGGSGILVLEELEAAKKRGAAIFGEIVGFGNVTDSGHIANPDKDSMIRAMDKAMEEAGISPADVDYVNAHATGTELGDIAEAEAIHSAINESTPVSTIKGHLGHMLGAAGAVELIASLEMMQRQEVVPTRNLENVDPRCPGVNLITKTQSKKIDVILKNNFALGGVNTSLAIRRYE